MAGDTPSRVMYVDLKRFGRMSNYEAARVLLADRPTEDGRLSPRDRIEDRTYLSRQIVNAAPGQQPPFVAYIGAILEQGRLNEIETIEFCKIILQQGKKQIIEKWVKEDKITCSEALGDMVAMQDARLAMAIYFKGKCHEKVVASLVRAQQYEKMLQ